MVVACETDMPLPELLRLGLEIERGCGRVRDEHATGYVNRTLDIDVLCTSNAETWTPAEGLDLHVPHPRMMSRRFVLQPLVDVAPDLEVGDKRVQDALANVPLNPQWSCIKPKPPNPLSMYASLAIEGGIGAGKTTFATWLSKDLGAELMLERFEENPFLEKFYENPEAHAFSVELSFLADRYKQMQGRHQKPQPVQAASGGGLQLCQEFDFCQGQFAQRRIQAVQHDVPNDGGATSTT